MSLPAWLSTLLKRLTYYGKSSSANPVEIDEDLIDGYHGEEFVTPPLEDWIDLHHYQPRETIPLLREYLGLCRSSGLLEVRIIHGKGKGVLRESVHALLSKEPYVESFRLASEREGGWGATIVRLKPWPAKVDTPKGYQAFSKY